MAARTEGVVVVRVIRNHLGAIGYLVLVAVLVVTHFRVEQVNDEVDRVFTYQVDLLCEQMNETRQMTLEILEATDPDIVDEFRPTLQERECPPPQPS